MEKMILSLKNIYMVLMTDDFPIYSESVIGRNDRKGQTVIRFWQGQIAEEFRCQPCGKTIWRNDGKRNRYTSYLCNRSGEIKTYCQYARELASQISVPAMMSQIRRFEEFLSSKKYRHDILIRRIQELMRLTEAEDPRVSQAIADQIRQAASQPLKSYGSREKLFQAAYLLTLMTLYGAAGEAMDDPVMAVLREDGYSLKALWEARNHRQEQLSAGVRYLTVRAGLLQDNPLPHNHFFGREEVLFDLQEMAASGGKYLISGIGGMGKTELLRQLIRLCEGEHTVDKIAAVTYQSALPESFERAFPGLRQKEPEESFRKIMDYLRKESADSSVLVLVDDVTGGVEEDPALRELGELPCTVLLTTRRTQLDGFQVYHLEPPSPAVCALIFRDNYGRPLTEEDRAELTQMLSGEVICHPLTLRLMAKAARSRMWSVGELKAHLKQKNVALTWLEEERLIRLNQMYSQLYSLLGIPEESRALAELFTLLPRDSYSADLLQAIFPSVAPQDGSLGDKLATLAEGGWLDADESGYSMHPLIVQCLRKKVITEAKLRPILQDLHRWMPESVAHGKSVRYSGNTVGSSHILLHIASLLSGSISRGLMLDILTAVNLQIMTIQRKKQACRLMEQMLKHCPERDDYVDMIHCTILTNWGMASVDQILTVYQKQSHCQGAARALFLDFCLTAGANLIRLRQSEAAGRVLQEVLCEDATSRQVATAYFHLTGRSQIMVNAEEALHWAERAVDYVKEHPDCGNAPTFFNMSMLCGLYIKFGRQEPALALLKELKGFQKESTMPVMRIKYMNLMGEYAQKYGRPEEALLWLQQQRDLTLEYYGKDRNYYSLQGSIARSLQRLKRYDEAEEAYGLALNYARQAGDGSLLQLVSNNLATLYLDEEKPTQALALLETAVTEGRNLGGLMLGEALWNMARACERLADPVREYDCLREAHPLLEEAYGPEHPAPAAARDRLAQLEKDGKATQGGK